MFKPHMAICICHNEKRLIVVKKGYCAEGNYEQKQRNKKSNGIERNSTSTSSLRRGRGCSSDVRRREEVARGVLRKFKAKTPTGEREVFEQISFERDWRCFVTGQTLTELKASTFAHCLPKALNKYPLFKLYKPNIVLLSDEIHYAWDFKPRSELRKDPRFDKLFELEEQLKQEYKLLKLSL